MEHLDALAAGASNLSHTTGQWLSAKASRANLSNVLPESPDAIFGGAALAASVVLLFVFGLVRAASLMVSRRRARNNALIVQLAEHAPEDDCDERECEQHSDARAAAPGDSDFEDDALGSPRKNSK